MTKQRLVFCPVETNMSDFEDDMEVDGVTSKDKSMQFSSDNAAAKGKRIQADLPVEAEDNLPWYERIQKSMPTC